MDNTAGLQKHFQRSGTRSIAIGRPGSGRISLSVRSRKRSFVEIGW